MLAAVLLAAGLSRRFGARRKLEVPVAGIPLGHHAARTLATIDASVRFMVIGEESGLAADGFETLVNFRADAGLSGSLAIGLRAARDVGATAILVALADMPLVTPAHLNRLVDRHDGPAALVASTDGTRAMPPALFGADHFDALLALQGDAGARALLDRAVLVQACVEELIDVDTEEDLAVARRILERPKA